MAKGARASTTKANNQKLKSRVFGPVETARTERLSAKLQELIAQPRPSQKVEDDSVMELSAGPTTKVDATVQPTKKSKQQDVMEVDEAVSKSSTQAKIGKGRIEKRRSSRSKAAIVFPKYKNGKKVGVSKSKR